MKKVLVVDDEEKICFAFAQFLKDRGLSPLIASTAEDALAIARAESPRVIFLDIRLPGRDGLSVLQEIKDSTNAQVVVMTGYGTMDTAIQAMQQGAHEYITKPIDLDQVGDLIDRLLSAKKVTPLDDISQPENRTTAHPETIVGKSRAIQDIYKMIGLMTMNDVPVLIEGESGVGKELVARAIHSNSDRRRHPFVAINCGAIPEHLLESELFGHEKGSFTGADAKKIGQFEYAGEGTIFLDEIAELKPNLQTKLLRVLQERQVCRVGGLEPFLVKARVITATNKNLAEEKDMGNFRNDLYYRLQLITLKIPPLRERREDIPYLVAHFIRKANEELGKKILGIETDAMDLLTASHWPGNVRELENVVRRSAVLTQGESLVIDRRDLSPENISGGGFSAEALVAHAAAKWFRRMNSDDFFAEGHIYENIVKTIEKTLILKALKACGNNQAKASRLLGMNRTTLRKKMAAHDISD